MKDSIRTGKEVTMPSGSEIRSPVEGILLRRSSAGASFPPFGLRTILRHLYESKLSSLLSFDVLWFVYFALIV